MGFLRASLSTASILALGAGIQVEARAGGKVGLVEGVLLAAAGMSLDQAVKMTEQRFKARVVRAETQKDGARTIYVLKLLNEAGRVWTVHVDAANGALL